jgi:signal transduction histidine kinase
MEKVEMMSKLTDTATQIVRRISADLRPAMLDDIGLLATMEWRLGEFQKRTGIIGEIVAQQADIVLEQEKSTALFRIFQEALTNVARHAGAKMVKVSLKKEGGKVLLKVEDDGIGIKAEEITSSSSTGIIGMRERVRMCRGQLRIKGIPGKGTTITVSIPVKEKKVNAEDTCR